MREVICTILIVVLAFVVVFRIGYFAGFVKGRKYEFNFMLDVFGEELKDLKKVV